MGPVRTSFGRSGVVLALLAAVFATPLTAVAQDGLNTKRKWIFGVIGAVAVGVPSYLILDDDEGTRGCTDRTCVAISAGAVAGAIGFLIGNDLDSKYARRMEAGPSLQYDYQNVDLDMVPDRMATFPGGAAVVGLGGARIVRKDGTSVSRGFGVRGIEDVAVVAGPDLLVLSTALSLLAFPLEGEEGQGQVIDERGGGSMDAEENRLAVAGTDSLRLLNLRSSGDELKVETLAGQPTSEFVSDMSFSSFGRTTWVLTENRVIGYGSDLQRIGQVTLPAVGRTVRARGGRLVVAAGTEGVYIIDATDPAAARVVQHFDGVRFAYAADLDEKFLYVAAGHEGLAVVDIDGPEPRVVGLARKVQFAADVSAAGGEQIWILDRDGRRVQIAEFESSTVDGDQRGEPE